MKLIGQENREGPDEEVVESCGYAKALGPAIAVWALIGETP